MSKIVTDRQFNLLVNHLDAPFKEKVTVHEALVWIREEKGIACGVCLDYYIVCKDWRYTGRYSYESELYTRYTPSFSSHPLAENALLDAVLIYLEE